MGPTIEEQRERIRRNRLLTQYKIKENIIAQERIDKALLLAEKLSKNATIHENIFREYLDNHLVKYEFQRVLFTKNTFYIIDFYIPESRLAIEIDGYYHFTDKGRKHDIKRDLALMTHNIKTIRISNDMFSQFTRIHGLMVKFGVVNYRR